MGEIESIRRVTELEAEERAIRQQIQDGSPARIRRLGIDLKFQLGPVKEYGKNGCQIEDVLDILISRLAAFQRGPFGCPENVLALDGLAKAKLALEDRKADREARGVEGKDEK